MKAIAEYFRDLAANDRYFGAEPPTPDAEMLQRIAEREIRRRVEAHVGEEGIVLRPEGAQAGLPAAPQVPEQPAPRAEPPAEPVGEPAAAAAPPPQPEPAPQPEPVAAAPSEPTEAPAAESVAAKLARIRAVVDHARAVPPMPDSGYTEDEEAEAPVFDTAQAFAETEEEAEAPAEAEAAETPAYEPAEAAQAEAPAAEEPAVAEEERAAPLAEEEPAEEEYEAETAEPEMAEAEEEAPEELLETSFSIEEEAEVSLSVEEEVEPETPALRLRRDKAAEEQHEEPTPESIEERLATEEAEAEEPVEEFAADHEEEVAEEPARVVTPEQAQGAAARARARVLKLKRADLEGTPAPQAQPEAAEEMAEPEEASDLSAEDEADLMAELAEVERDAERASRRQGRARLQSSELEEEESAVSRLIETTNTKLEGTENRRRRTAIAHLKAAVAATVAERRLSRGRDEEAEEAEMAPYRQDLAKVVRPRRPERPASTKERKKLAPLMLVSEQRIDESPAPSPAPTRPRRVSSGNLALQPHPEEEIEESALAPEAGDFAEFAEARGARDLSDLLEAAGAYLAEVEGMESFSRPQAMRLVDEVREGEISREDRLRAFGRLLREGKFERIKRGQFTVTESSRFRAG